MRAGTGTRLGDGDEIFWTGFWERDGNMASKDIAESPTASPERPKERLQVNKTIRLQVFLVRSEELF